MDSQEKFQTYEVGKIYPELKGVREGGRIEHIPGTGWSLYVSYSNLKKNEISILKDGPFEMTFENIQGVGFFCFKFGKMSLDIPFYFQRTGNGDQGLNEIADGQGYLLTVIIVENTTGEIKGLRAIGIGNGISNEIRRYCLISMESGMTHQQYSNIVNDVYAKYTIEQLMQRATCYWKLRL